MDQFHERHRGLLNPTIIANKRVLIVGCGSIGSVAAALLARSGVENFVLVDPDEVSGTNICRSVFGEGDIGMPKVAALTNHLRAIRKGLQIDARETDLRDIDDPELEELIGAADMVIAATDHPPTQGRLGALSYHRAPTVFPGVYARGTGGEVIFTIPDQTPCYACVLGAVRNANMPSRGQAEYGIATGQLAAEPALGIDIGHVTVCASKVALALLLLGSGADAETILDPARSVLFVGNQVDWIWKAPFETVWARANRRESCVCRLAPGASTADLLDGEEDA